MIETEIGNRMKWWRRHRREETTRYCFPHLPRVMSAASRIAEFKAFVKGGKETGGRYNPGGVESYVTQARKEGQGQHGHIAQSRQPSTERDLVDEEGEREDALKKFGSATPHQQRA